MITQQELNNIIWKACDTLEEEEPVDMEAPVKTAIKSTLNANGDYLNRSLDELERLLAEVDDQDPFRSQFVRIERLTLIIGTELLRRGYSKSHAYHQLNEYILKKEEPFVEVFERLRSFVTAPEVNYNVTLRVYSPKSPVNAWVKTNDWTVTKSGLAHDSMKNFVKNWLEEKHNHVFLTSECRAMDHRSAASKTVAAFAENIDLMKLADRNLVPQDRNKWQLDLPSRH